MLSFIAGPLPVDASPFLGLNLATTRNNRELKYSIRSSSTSQFAAAHYRAFATTTATPFLFSSSGPTFQRINPPEDLGLVVVSMASCDAISLDGHPYDPPNRSIAILG